MATMVGKYLKNSFKLAKTAPTLSKYVASSQSRPDSHLIYQLLALHNST